MSVGVAVLGSRFGCKLFLLRALGHGKGIHDGFGRVAGNASAMQSRQIHTSFDGSVVHPLASSIHLFCSRSYLSMHRNAGMLSKLIPCVDRGTRKGSPSFAMFPSPPISPHYP
jgi:hypothetical protein